MDPVSLIALLLGGLTTAAAGQFTPLVEKLVEHFGGRGRRSEPGFEARVERLTALLRDSATEAQAVADEMAEVIQKRAVALAEAERQLVEMEAKEADLAARLANLEQLQPDAVRVFEEAMDRRFAKTDRSAKSFFIWGVVATTVVSAAVFALTLWLT